ncbi:MAG: HAD family hydrolase [Leptolyngbyaceae cyanobacterium]
MSAILFGSIGAIAETSELQRQAFNKAFEREGLDWHWSREEYMPLLQKSGGRQRIEDYAHSRGQSVDTEKLHQSKSQIFQNSLQEGELKPRLGVVETIHKAKQNGLNLAFVTTTSEQNVASILAALNSSFDTSAFDLVTTAAHVKQSKPSQEVYLLALKKLGEQPDSCIAIEDNLGGVKASKSAGISCVAFPGENTADHDFEAADWRVSHLDFDELMQFMAQR